MWSVSTNRHSTDHPFHFSDLLALQEAELLRLRPLQESALLFAELAPTLTLGARQVVSEEARARFQNLALAVVAGERGGNETWHGPGQWVGFVLSPLQKFTGDSKGVRKAVHHILEAVQSVAKLYVPEVELREGSELGLWSSVGKLASVGIKIKDGYITSGFALNCIPHAQAFLGIHPCGITGTSPDFLLRNQAPAQQEMDFLKLPSLISARFAEMS